MSNSINYSACGDESMVYYFVYFSYLSLEQYEEAVRDYEKVFKLEPNRGKQQPAVASLILSI